MVWEAWYKLDDGGTEVVYEIVGEVSYCYREKVVIELEVALTFFAVCLSLCLIPGPELVLVLSQSTLQGRSAGIAITLGVCTAAMIHVVAMALGLTVIFQTSEMAFNLLKVAGVLYLLFVAWQTLRQPMPVQLNEETSTVETQLGERSLGALYRNGVFITGSNALTPLFLMFFLPPFVKSGSGSAFTQLLQLGGLMVLSALLVFSILSLLADVFGNKLFQFRRAYSCIKYGSSAVLVFFACYLAFADQNLM